MLRCTLPLLLVLSVGGLPSCNVPVGPSFQKTTELCECGFVSCSPNQYCLKSVNVCKSNLPTCSTTTFSAGSVDSVPCKCKDTICTGDQDGGNGQFCSTELLKGLRGQCSRSDSVYFKYRTSGKCPSANLIKNSVDCANAAVALGMNSFDENSDTTLDETNYVKSSFVSAKQTAWVNGPGGCYKGTTDQSTAHNTMYPKIEANVMRLNSYQSLHNFEATVSSNPFSAACSSSKPCLCFIGNACSNKDGTIDNVDSSNGAACMCSTRICTPATGFYCDARFSATGRGPGQCSKFSKSFFFQKSMGRCSDVRWKISIEQSYVSYGGFKGKGATTLTQGADKVGLLVEQKQISSGNILYFIVDARPGVDFNNDEAITLSGKKGNGDSGNNWNGGSGKNFVVSSVEKIIERQGHPLLDDRDCGRGFLEVGGVINGAWNDPGTVFTPWTLPLSEFKAPFMQTKTPSYRLSSIDGNKQTFPRGCAMRSTAVPVSSSAYMIEWPIAYHPNQGQPLDYKVSMQADGRISLFHKNDVNVESYDCGSYYKSIGSPLRKSVMTCICWDGPACENTFGKDSNPADCMCNEKLCSAVESGLYCTTATSTCSFQPKLVCTATDGKKPNLLGDCLCGEDMALCNEANGRYCVVGEPTSTCFVRPPTLCQNTLGKTINAEDADCKCTEVEEADCNLETGLFCHALVDECTKVPACTNTDGLVGNSNPCVCGTKLDMCNSTAGLICSASASTKCSCHHGTYRSENDNSKCVVCPKGWFSNDLDVSMCQICEAGKFSGQEAATACSLMDIFTCGTGEAFTSVTAPINLTGSTANDGVCTACAAGKSKRSIGPTSCSDCSTGQYAALPKQVNCSSCPAGYRQHSTGKELCVECEKGKYNNEMSSSTETCKLCANGKYGDTMHSSSCKKCLKGKDLNSKGSTNVNDCKKCSKGTFNPFDGSPDPCYPCAFGKTLEGETSCDGCDKGFYVVPVDPPDVTNPDLISCIDCPLGYYQSLRNNQTCVSCDAGRYANEKGSISCIDCPRGRFGVTTGAKALELGCQLCGSGMFSDTEGQIICTNCGRGKYLIAIGSTQEKDCLNCNAGKYGSTDAADSVDKCLECSAGKYGNNVASASEEECQQCPIGFAQNVAGQAYCLPCVPGTYNNQENQITCKYCGKNNYTDSVRQTICKKCDDGENSETGSAKCTKCDAGEAGTGDNGACEACQVGQYRNVSMGTTMCFHCPAGWSSEAGSTKCQSCEAGTFSSVIGAACQNCAAGQYRQSKKEDAKGNLTDESTDPTTCVNCPAGWSSDTGSTKCQSCEAGKYGDAVGAVACKNCNSGQYRTRDEEDATSCVPCSVGTYQDRVGQASCFPCIPGSINDQVGQDQCKDCVAGEYRGPDDKADKCLECAIGDYSTAASSVCSGCDLGKFGATPGECADCPIGKYNDVRGLQKCRDCIGGQVPNNQSTSCTKPDYVIVSDCDRDEYLDDGLNGKKPLKEQRCKICLKGGNCTGQKFNFLSTLRPIQPGYWKIPLYLDPKEDAPFERCPYMLDCISNADTNRTCRNGTTGLLCSQCQVGYDRIGSTCSECSDSEIGSRVSLLLAILIVACAFIVMCKRRLKRLHTRYGTAWKDVALAFKILISFQQINSSLPSMVDTFEWPEVYVQFLTRLKPVVNVDLFSLIGLQCAVDVDYRYSLLMSFFIPLLVIAGTYLAFRMGRKRAHAKVDHELTADDTIKTYAKVFDLCDFDESGEIDEKEFQHLIHAVSTHCTKLSGKEILLMMAKAGAKRIQQLEHGKVVETMVLSRDDFLKGNISEYFSLKRAVHWIVEHESASVHISGAVQLLLLFHAPVSAKSFMYFDCQEIGSSSSFLRRDLKIQCYTPNWNVAQPVALVLMVGFAFLFPMLLASYLFAHRQTLHSPGIRQKIGWLYSRYTRGSEWWEIFEVVRKMVLTGLLIYLPADSRPSAAILICASAVAILNYARPHKKHILFWVCQISFALTTVKYLVTTMSATQELKGDASHSLGMLLITMDVAIMVFGAVAIVLIFLVLRNDIVEIQKKEQMKQEAVAGEKEDEQGGGRGSGEDGGGHDAHVYAALKMRQNMKDALALRISGQAKNSRSKQMKRRKSSFSAQTITKAVTNDRTERQVASLEQQQMVDREQFQTNLKQREAQADLRVQARLKERNQKTKKGRKMKVEMGQQQQQQSGGVKVVPVKSGAHLTKDDKARQIIELRRKVETLKRVTQKKMEVRKEEEELARDFGSDSD